MSGKVGDLVAVLGHAVKERLKRLHLLQALVVLSNEGALVCDSPCGSGSWPLGPCWPVHSVKGFSFESGPKSGTQTRRQRTVNRFIEVEQ